MDRPLAAQEGRSRKLAALYEQHVGSAVALATLLTGDAHVAEDISHEAFVRGDGSVCPPSRGSCFRDIPMRRTVVNLVRLDPGGFGSSEPFLRSI